MKKDVTPIKPTFKNLTYLCMQTLTNFPYIEEDFDAITNYELLCKVVEYLNKVIGNENAQNQVITELANAFNELKDYVDNYFDNLDVQDEINNKLEEMAADGTLEGIFIHQSYDTQYIRYNDTSIDISDTLSNLTDGQTIVIQKGNYTCDEALIEADDVTILCEDGAVITTTSYAFEVDGNNFTMKGGKIIAPEEWYPATSVDLYGVIKVDGTSTFEDVTFYNIPKIGLYCLDSVKCINCNFLGNMPSSYYETTSINNQVYGLYIKATSSYAETSKVINCKFNDLIEGIYFGDYNYPVNTYSILVDSCIFKKIYDHSCYINGSKNGIISNCIAHESNHAFVMMGEAHSILNNTVYLPTGESAIHVTGISFREPKYCKAIGNTIIGSGTTGTSGIMLQNLSGDPSPNTTIENVIINENIFKSTGVIVPIRIGTSSQTTSVKNVTIDNNIFDCENNPDQGFINFQVAGISNIDIKNNIFNLHELFKYGIVTLGGELNIENNIFNLKDIAAISAITMNLINGVVNGYVRNNKVKLDNSSLTNVTLNLIRYTTGTTKLIVENNELPANARLFNNPNNVFNGIISRNNIVGTDTCSGSFTTNASGAYTITNKTFTGGINKVIVTAADENSAIFTNYYFTTTNNSNTINIYTTGVTTNINLNYYII